MSNIYGGKASGISGGLASPLYETYAEKIYSTILAFYLSSFFRLGGRRVVWVAVGEDDSNRNNRHERKIVGSAFFAADFGGRGDESRRALYSRVLCSWPVRA